MALQDFPLRHFNFPSLTCLFLSVSIYLLLLNNKKKAVSESHVWSVLCIVQLKINVRCLLSVSAGRRLRGKAFYYVGGKVFCEEDFLVSGQYTRYQYTV